MSALAIARAVHYIAIAQAFGALVFALALADGESDAVERRVVSLVRWSAGIALASWLGWFAAAMPAMAGMPAAQALTPPIAARVLGETSFGHAWLARLALLAILALIVTLRRPRTRDVSVPDMLATFVAAVAVASLAEVGHAAASAGADRALRIGVDALHLVAAGAWLGALLPLAIALRATAQPARERVLARRFSVLGIVCVALLIATGVVNAAYLVASWPALFGTTYGQLLIAKLALFVAMLALAAWNLLRGTPRLAGGDARAATSIARNARAEALLGVGVLAIVGALGAGVPAAHDEIRWPFAFRLAFDERVPTVIAANPTTYARPASRNTVGVIVHGGAVYAANCASCHGADGRGTASGAPALAAEHVLAHRAGDLYWWITHGIERTAMPAFGDRISERERWDVVHYVVALAAASALPDDGHAPYAIAAPEFAFQIDRRPQQSVAANAPAATLLVLYTLPESHERLLEIATELPDLARAGIRVAAVPMRAGEAPADDPRVQNIVALGSRGLVDAYRVFAADAAHVEVLIDREGLLRARWRSAFVPPAQIAREYASLPAAKAAAAHDHGH